MVKRITVNNQEVSYTDTGSGDPLLLLHGWGCDSQIWGKVAQDLAMRRRVIVVDFPGFGASPVPSTAWSVKDYSDCVIEFIKQLALEKVDIIAHSFGGRVALYIAGNAELVGKMLLTGAAGIPFRLPLWKKTLKPWIRPTKKLLQRLGKPGTKIEKSILNFYADSDYLTAGPMLAIYKKVVSEDLTPLLPTIQAPTLLIFGAHDTSTPLYQARALQQGIKNSELVVFESAGHFAFIDEPDRFMLYVKKFFEL